MNIEKIEIRDWFFSGSRNMGPDGLCHIKSLPCLSVVQAQEGSYDIGLNDSPIQQTGEGGFFIAPAQVKQTIVHHFSHKAARMTARWLFLDVVFNGKYRYEDLFVPPVILPESHQRIMDGLFDKLTEQEDVCDCMSLLYQVIKSLIQVSETKAYQTSDALLSAIKYIHAHFADRITVRELAAAANMSESNFYAVFRKQMGVSPIVYLNQYRLTLASRLLKSTNDSIGAISAATGFADPFYFSRMFKDRFQLSPREYRKLHIYD